MVSFSLLFWSFVCCACPWLSSGWYSPIELCLSMIKCNWTHQFTTSLWFNELLKIDKNTLFCSHILLNHCVYRMNWGMLYCLFLRTSKIFQMLWMLQRSLISLVFTPLDSATGNLIGSLCVITSFLVSITCMIFVCPSSKKMFVWLAVCRYIQSTCATSGEGLYEGLEWLSNNIANKVWWHSHCSEFRIPLIA